MKMILPKRKQALTLAEVSIVFFIIGIVSLGFVGIEKIKKDTLQKQMSYAAFNSLRDLSGRNIADGNELTTESKEEDSPNYQACKSINSACNLYRNCAQSYCINVVIAIGGDVHNYKCSEALATASSTGVTVSKDELNGSYDNYANKYNTNATTLGLSLSQITSSPTDDLIGGYYANSSDNSTGTTSNFACEITCDKYLETTTTTTVEKALPETGAKLCEKAANSYNTIGVTHCTDGSIVNDSSNFKTAIPNFVTTNAIAFYNFSSNPTAGVAGDYSTQLYTIYADIDGVNKGKSKLNEDVLKFTLRRDGIALPAADSIIANNTNYLSSAVKYETFSPNLRQANWVGTGLTYREAACKSGLITGTYCNAVTGYPTSYTKNSTCNTNVCKVLINKPFSK